MTVLADRSKVTEQAVAFPDRAREIRILDVPTYEAACEFLKGIKALREEIAETFDPHIKRAHDAHKALLREKATAEAPLADAERIAKSALVVWTDEQERLRRAEQARLDALARRQAEDDRLAEAAALAEAGHVDQADACLDEPVVVAAVAVAPTMPKVAGVAYRETWSARVTDPLALVKFVAANPAYLPLVNPDMPSLNAQARSLKSRMQLPGVEAVCTKTVAAGK